MEYKSDKQETVVNFILNNYDNLADKRIIEVGGGCTPSLLHIDALEKVNLEINPNRITSGRDIINVNANVQDGIPYPNNYFDICIFTDVMEHLTDVAKGIKEIHRTSKNIIVTTPNNSLTRKILKIITLNKDINFVGARQTKCMELGSGHIREYSWKEVIDIFENTGYHLDKFVAMNFIIPRIKLKWFPRFSSKVFMSFKKGVH